MKRGIFLFSAIFAMGLYIMGCESEENGGTDTHVDVPPDYTPPDTTPDYVPDTVPDIVPDIVPDTTPDITPDITPDTTPDITPDIEPDSTGPYGTINANFSSAYIFDGDRLSDSEYLQSHMDGISTSAVFTGSFGSGKSIPNSTAVQTIALAAHMISSGGNYVGVMQQSAADAAGTTPANPWVELDFTSDAISTGSYDLDITEGAQAMLAVLNALASDYCILAMAVGGSVNVTNATNTTATEGGSLALSGSSIPIYHPSNTPYGDITADLEASGISVCPIE